MTETSEGCFKRLLLITRLLATIPFVACGTDHDSSGRSVGIEDVAMRLGGNGSPSGARSTTSTVLVRTQGRQRFENVSDELLYVNADLDGDGSTERYNLFNSRLTDYYWNYDNSGLKLAQLRFYEIPTNVN